MRRRDLVRSLAGFVAATPFSAGAQDLGKFLEKAARDSFDRALDPRQLERNSRQAIPGSGGQNTAAGPELVPFKTPDGWNLVVHHYAPANGRPRAGALPVVLCHGLTYSAAFWDLEPSVSFARYLSGLGLDVWAVDLRGSGLSHKWVYRLEQAPDALIGGALRRATGGGVGPTGFASLDPRYANWTLDDHAAYDVSSTVKLVQRRTGSQQVAWVGHSMGGIVALAHLARFQNPGIGRLVTVGSQVTMRDAQLVMPFLSEMLQARQLQLTGQPQPADLVAASRSSVSNLFFNTQHVSPSVYQALDMSRTDVPSLGLMKQYMALSSEGELKDASKKFNYAQSLGNVQIPALICCGSVDRFAPPSVQKDVYDRLGSQDKTLLVFGRAQGYPADSGHDDALVGLTSSQQVYPTIARWLVGQSVANPAARPVGAMPTSPRR